MCAWLTIAEHAHGAFAIRRKQPAEERFAQLELQVLPAGSAEVPVEIDSVGDGRHQRERVTCRPVLVVVLGDDAVSVAAGVRGVVPRAIIVDGPVHELEVTVGADAVEVEVVGQADLADVKLEAALRRPELRAKTGYARHRHELVGKPDGLVKLDAGHIGR